MDYIEYTHESTNLKNLESSFIPNELYEKIHETSVIVCHDVFIKCTHNNEIGFLLVKRLNEPAKDVLWPIGGRLLRGLPAEISLTKKVKAECNLTLSDIVYIGTARTFFEGEPFGHNHGTDTLNLVYIAEGKGELILDHMHESPLILTKEIYHSNITNLPEYVQYFLRIIDEKNLW